MMKVLVIGQGSIGKRHREILISPPFASTVDVVSRHCSKNQATWNALSEVPEPGAYDYYVIASETSHHKRDLDEIEQVATGKRILIEKPIFDRPLQRIATRNSIFVGYNLRFHPVVQSLRRRLAKRRVISVQISTGQYLPTWRPGRDYRKSYSASRSRGGGVLLDLSHEIDYAAWLFGKIVRVKAISRKLSNLEINSDDVMSLVGVTSRGVVISISMDYLSRIPVRRMAVQCDNATFVADLITAKLELKEDRGARRTIVFPPVERNSTYRAMHVNILAADNKCVACPLEDALETLKVVQMIKESSKRDWIRSP